VAHDVRPGREPVYDAAERFVDQYLRMNGSLFRPGEAVATSETLADLDERFRGQADEGSDSFLAKFERQLNGAPEKTILLAAELLYTHLLFAGDIGGPSKRRTLTTVLSWMKDPADIPPDLDAPLDVGLANTGIAFKRYRPHQLWFLIDALTAYKRLAAEEATHLRDDPWAFKELLWKQPITAAYTQREALLHLVHPETFEPICSREHKQRIVEAFSDRLDPPSGDVDRDLLAIRRSLEAERGDFRGFYEPGVVEVWKGHETDEVERTTGTVRAWLVRHKVAGDGRLDRWLTDGYAAIGWMELGPEATRADRDRLAELVATAYPDSPPGRRRGTVGNVHRFLHQIRVGDLLVSADGDAIHIGVVSSPAEYVANQEESYRRSVEWANPIQPVSRSDLSESAYSKLRTLLTVSDITSEAAEFADLAGVSIDHEGEAASSPLPPRKPREVHLPDADAQLADSLLLPTAWLQETIELLRAKRQLIFYGPPGTGKTYVAQRLADHLTQQGGTYTLVQFHPSYAYEDFFEGFRPRPSDVEGGVAFELVPGPLRRIAEQAADDADNPYVLLIDEINRANLAKVFGELYFLLEYRERSIALQYSPDEEFSLPRNLFVIGTMNTADRSIARVDAAMRRRFLFVPYYPDRHPIDGLLERWLREHGYSQEPAQLLAELNRRMDEPDATVGPSYLMSDDVEHPRGLERIWHHAILPLLTEHYLGTGVEVSQRFGLAALRNAIARGDDRVTPERVRFEGKSRAGLDPSAEIGDEEP
jgi:5-methylcytosine-specific restriction enzyme B